MGQKDYGDRGCCGICCARFWAELGVKLVIWILVIGVVITLLGLAYVYGPRLLASMSVRSAKHTEDYLKTQATSIKWKRSTWNSTLSLSSPTSPTVFHRVCLYLHLTVIALIVGNNAVEASLGGSTCLESLRDITSLVLLIIYGYQNLVDLSSPLTLLSVLITDLVTASMNALYALYVTKTKSLGPSPRILSTEWSTDVYAIRLLDLGETSQSEVSGENSSGDEMIRETKKARRAKRPKAPQTEVEYEEFDLQAFQGMKREERMSMVVWQSHRMGAFNIACGKLKNGVICVAGLLASAKLYGVNRLMKLERLPIIILSILSVLGYHVFEPTYRTLYILCLIPYTIAAVVFMATFKTIMWSMRYVFYQLAVANACETLSGFGIIYSTFYEGENAKRRSWFAIRKSKGWNALLCAGIFFSLIALGQPSNLGGDCVAVNSTIYCQNSKTPVAQMVDINESYSAGIQEYSHFGFFNNEGDYLLRFRTGSILNLRSVSKNGVIYGKEHNANYNEDILFDILSHAGSNQTSYSSHYRMPLMKRDWNKPHCKYDGENWENCSIIVHEMEDINDTTAFSYLAMEVKKERNFKNCENAYQYNESTLISFGVAPGPVKCLPNLPEFIPLILKDGRMKFVNNPVNGIFSEDEEKGYALIHKTHKNNALSNPPILVLCKRQCPLGYEAKGNVSVRVKRSIQQPNKTSNSSCDSIIGHETVANPETVMLTIVYFPIDAIGYLTSVSSAMPCGGVEKYGTLYVGDYACSDVKIGKEGVYCNTTLLKCGPGLISAYYPLSVTHKIVKRRASLYAYNGVCYDGRLVDIRHGDYPAKELTRLCGGSFCIVYDKDSWLRQVDCPDDLKKELEKAEEQAAKGFKAAEAVAREDMKAWEAQRKINRDARESVEKVADAINELNRDKVSNKILVDVVGSIHNNAQIAKENGRRELENGITTAQVAFLQILGSTAVPISAMWNSKFSRAKDAVDRGSLEYIKEFPIPKDVLHPEKKPVDLWMQHLNGGEYLAAMFKTGTKARLITSTSKVCANGSRKEAMFLVNQTHQFFGKFDLDKLSIYDRSQYIPHSFRTQKVSDHTKHCFPPDGGYNVSCSKEDVLRTKVTGLKVVPKHNLTSRTIHLEHKNESARVDLVKQLDDLLKESSDNHSRIKRDIDGVKKLLNDSKEADKTIKESVKKIGDQADILGNVSGKLEEMERKLKKLHDQYKPTIPGTKLNWLEFMNLVLVLLIITAQTFVNYVLYRRCRRLEFGQHAAISSGQTFGKDRMTGDFVIMIGKLKVPFTLTKDCKWDVSFDLVSAGMASEATESGALGCHQGDIALWYKGSPRVLKDLQGVTGAQIVALKCITEFVNCDSLLDIGVELGRPNILYILKVSEQGDVEVAGEITKKTLSGIEPVTFKEAGERGRRKLLSLLKKKSSTIV